MVEVLGGLVFVGFGVFLGGVECVVCGFWRWLWGGVVFFFVVWLFGF